MVGIAEQRLIDVELKLMHQDRLLETLNEVIIELRGELEALRKQVDHMATQQSGDEGEAPANDPPPHY